MEEETKKKEEESSSKDKEAPATPLVKPRLTQSDVNEAEVEKDSQVTPESIGTPQSSKFLDIASDTSPATSMISASSTATPSMPRGRGRPCKILTKPDFSDFPVGGSYEEQECWFKAKKTTCGSTIY